MGNRDKVLVSTTLLYLEREAVQQTVVDAALTIETPPEVGMARQLAEVPEPQPFPGVRLEQLRNEVLELGVALERELVDFAPGDPLEDVFFLFVEGVAEGAPARAQLEQETAEGPEVHAEGLEPVW